jgi:hypothetical protein
MIVKSLIIWKPSSIHRLEVVDCLVDNGAPIDTYAYNVFSRCAVVVAISGLKKGLQLAIGYGKKDMVGLL